MTTVQNVYNIFGVRLLKLWDHAFWSLMHFQNGAKSSGAKKHVLRPIKKKIPCFLLLPNTKITNCFFILYFFDVLTDCQTDSWFASFSSFNCADVAAAHVAVFKVYYLSKMSLLFLFFF